MTRSPGRLTGLAGVGAEDLEHLGQRAVVRRREVEAEVAERDRGELPARVVPGGPEHAEKIYPLGK